MGKDPVISVCSKLDKQTDKCFTQNPLKELDTSVKRIHVMPLMNSPRNQHARQYLPISKHLAALKIETPPRNLPLTLRLCIKYVNDRSNRLFSCDITATISLIVQHFHSEHIKQHIKGSHLSRYCSYIRSNYMIIPAQNTVNNP